MERISVGLLIFVGLVCGCMALAGMDEISMNEEFLPVPPVLFSTSKDCTLMSIEMLRQTAYVLSAVGFKNIIMLLDDCWLESYRNFRGGLVVKSGIFPNGIHDFIKEMHKEYDVRIGLGVSAGKESCRGSAGISGYEKSDISTLLSYGADFIHLDGCGSFVDPQSKFELVSELIANSSTPVPYSICNWNKFGNEPNYGHKIANIWCISSLFSNSWQQVGEKTKAAEKYRDLGQSGHWNLGFQIAQTRKGDLNDLRLLLSLQAIYNQVIILDQNVVNATAEYVAVIRNQEILSAQQNLKYPPGGLVHANAYDIKVFAKQTGPKQYLVVVANFGLQASYFHLKFTYFYHHLSLFQRASVKEVWKGRQLGEYYNQFSFPLSILESKSFLIDME